MAGEGNVEYSGASPEPRASRHGRDHDRRHRDDGIERRERKRYDRDDDGDSHNRRRYRKDRDDDGYNRRREDGYDDGDIRRREDGYDRRGDRRGREEYRSSRSDDRSKSQRMSGFDLAPTTLPLAGVSMPALPVLATRHARRIYVGGIPPTANEQSVAAFFSHVMAVVGGNSAGPGDCVINVYINHDKKMAFVEMRSVEEASNAMALNGVFFEGAPVKVKRPSDYNPALAAPLGPSEPNPNLNLAALGLTGSTGVLEGPDRIFIGGLPYTITEPQIRELLESFGPLKGLDLIRDKDTGNSKGYAFCAYQDPSFTDIACASLNGLQIAQNRTLKVNRASQGTSPSNSESVLLQAQQHIALQKQLLLTSAIPTGATKVVCLIGALNADDLIEDEEYEDTVEDMEGECKKFGSLIKVVIPRTGDGAGRVFLVYADVQSSAMARQSLHGRVFDKNKVVAAFYPDDKFTQGDYAA